MITAKWLWLPKAHTTALVPDVDIDHPLSGYWFNKYDLIEECLIIGKQLVIEG